MQIPAGPTPSKHAASRTPSQGHWGAFVQDGDPLLGELMWLLKVRAGLAASSLGGGGQGGANQDTPVPPGTHRHCSPPGRGSGGNVQRFPCSGLPDPAFHPSVQSDLHPPQASQSWKNPRQGHSLPVTETESPLLRTPQCLCVNTDAQRFPRPQGQKSWRPGVSPTPSAVRPA